jgi:hypothetical protein
MILMLAGNAGVGKDTVAKEIAVKVPSTHMISQAEPIKEAVRQLGATQEQLYGPSEARNTPISFNKGVLETYSLDGPDTDYYAHQICKKFAADGLGDLKHFHPVRKWLTNPKYVYQGVTVRSLLQTLGTECGRNNIHPDIWINLAINRAYGLLRTENLVVITDGRFRNEILNVRKNGGKVVKIVTNKPPNMAKMTHQSELELASIPDFWYDAVVENNFELPPEKTAQKILYRLGI